MHDVELVEVGGSVVLKMRDVLPVMAGRGTESRAGIGTCGAPGTGQVGEALDSPAGEDGASLQQMGPRSRKMI